MEQFFLLTCYSCSFTTTMEPANQYLEHTDEEILQEFERLQPKQMYDSLIFGFLIGLMISYVLYMGVDFMILLPLIYLPFALRNARKRREVRRVLRERNLW